MVLRIGLNTHLDGGELRDESGSVYICILKGLFVLNFKAEDQGHDS